jgi:hypothetical protein
MFRAVKDVKSAHTQVVNRSFAIKGAPTHFLVVAGDPPPKTAGIKLSGENPMRGHPYLDILENGSPLAVKAASLVVAAILVLVVALPVLAVGAAVVA